MKYLTIALIAGTTLIAGCASNPRLKPPPDNLPVAFVVTAGSPGASGKQVRDSAVRQDARTGRKAGATAGALSGLACGPLWMICMPVGAVVAGSVGAVTGAAVGLADKLPRKKVEQLRDRLASVQQANDPVLLLQTNVTERAGRNWQLTNDTSRNVVTLELQSVFLTANRKSDIAMVMQVLVSVRTNGLDQKKPNSQKLYEFVAPASALDVWLDERSDIAATSLRNAVQQIASQVVAELSVR